MFRNDEKWINVKCQYQYVNDVNSNHVNIKVSKVKEHTNVMCVNDMSRHNATMSACKYVYQFPVPESVLNLVVVRVQLYLASEAAVSLCAILNVIVGSGNIHSLSLVPIRRCEC